MIANLNCFVLFVANKGNAAKKQSLNPSLVPSAANSKLYLSCQLENLLMVLSGPGMNKWQEEVSKQYHHLHYTILIRLQNALATWVSACCDLENNENAGKNIAPICTSTFVEEFDAAMSMLLNDIMMAKHSQTAGNFAMAPMTYPKYCPVFVKSEKTYDKQAATQNQNGRSNTSGDKRNRVNFNDDSTRREPNDSSKKAKTDDQIEFSKTKGMFNVVPDKSVNTRVNKPPIIEFRGKRAPLCLKHCTTGMACTFKSCRFHHINEGAAKSLCQEDIRALNEYQKSEPAITWNGDAHPSASTQSVAPIAIKKERSTSETQTATEGN
jgi:hypothetical protein